MADLQQRSEIAFFEVETTMPTRSQGQGRALLEFGAILVCPETLVELENYSTLICPNNPSFINSIYDRCNGITRAAVSAAPPFSHVADKIFHLLNGRIWAGHNILRFDCPLIRDAFAEIGWSPPEPKGIIDSLDLLTQRFGRRAGNMKMDTLATYFGLGPQTHRSLDDVRMNLEILKYCSTVLFLESSLPDILASDTLMSHNRHETRSFNMGRLSEDDAIAESEGCSSRISSGFLTPDVVNMTSITVFRIPFYHGSHKIQILHNYAILKLHCTNLRVRFGIRTKFFDDAGRPRLSFVVDAPPSICQILDACDLYAQRLFMEFGSTSDWRPVVTNKYWNLPTIRLNIPTVVTGDVAKYGTEIFQKEASSGAEQKLLFRKFDAAELESFLTAGNFVDAFFSLDTYDYRHNAGIRLVSQKLVIHCTY